MKPLQVTDNRTSEELERDGDDRWPDGSEYRPPDELRDNLLDLGDFYCNAATEALRDGDPSLASARAQIAISINLNRLVCVLESVIYDRGDGAHFLRVENTK